MIKRRTIYIVNSRYRVGLQRSHSNDSEHDTTWHMPITYMNWQILKTLNLWLVYKWWWADCIIPVKDKHGASIGLLHGDLCLFEWRAPTVWAFKPESLERQISDPFKFAFKFYAQSCEAGPTIFPPRNVRRASAGSGNRFSYYLHIWKFSYHRIDLQICRLKSDSNYRETFLLLRAKINTRAWWFDSESRRRDSKWPHQHTSLVVRKATRQASHRMPMQANERLKQW
jgi:hypothetical protein